LKSLLGLLFSGALLIAAGGIYPEDIVVNAVGDVMLGTLYPVPKLPPEGGASEIKFIEPYMTNGNPDIVIANLEGASTLYSNSTKDVSAGNNWAFQMPPDYMRYLRDAHITTVNQANNHAMDFGERGFLDTRKNLDRFGIKYIALKNEVLTYTIKGRRVAVIGFSWFDFSNNILKPREYVNFIKMTAASNDIVIVEFHGGGEGENFMHVRNAMEYYGDGARGNVIEFARLAVDSGASLILGSSPHVVRAMEIYKNKLIAYSLGNFITYEMMRTDGARKYTLILNVSLDGKGDFLSGRIIPLVQYESGELRGVPRYDDNGNAIKIISSLSRSDIKNNRIVISDDGLLSKKSGGTMK
jgi:hypothetical protein